MAKRKKLKMKQKGKNSLVVIICLIGTIVCAFLIGKTAYRYYSENKEYNDLVAEKKQLEEDIEDLQDDVKNSEDEDYIIKSARERYGFTESGEEVVKLPKD